MVTKSKHLHYLNCSPAEAGHRRENEKSPPRPATAEKKEKSPPRPVHLRGRIVFINILITKYVLSDVRVRLMRASQCQLRINSPGALFCPESDPVLRPENSLCYHGIFDDLIRLCDHEICSGSFLLHHLSYEGRNVGACFCRRRSSAVDVGDDCPLGFFDPDMPVICHVC